jgi:hypothetical protein
MVTHYIILGNVAPWYTLSLIFVWRRNKYFTTLLLLTAWLYFLTVFYVRVHTSRVGKNEDVYHCQWARRKNLQRPTFISSIERLNYLICWELKISLRFWILCRFPLHSALCVAARVTRRRTVKTRENSKTKFHDLV